MSKGLSKNLNSQSGFTLLEVIVAMAITGFYWVVCFL
ncbi:MAG: hypothetical protein CM1200mP40_33080 [Gammaproteobacteria bacterium]|nr:MAG: hypothetical protein CM1200mP40_33080 [Gammaproteobacteria bacterium]